MTAPAGAPALSWVQLKLTTGWHARGANGDHYWVEKINAPGTSPEWQLTIRNKGETTRYVWDIAKTGKALKAEAQRLANITRQETPA